MSDEKIGHNGGPPLDWSEYGGFTVEARDSWNHPIIGYGQPVKPADPLRGSFSKNEAWRDLIRECRYSDGHVMNGGRKMALMRGELIGAVSWLAARWNWTPKTVRIYLDKLEGDGMILRFTRSPDGSEAPREKGNQIGNRSAVVRVSNYSVFNQGPSDRGQGEGQSSGNQAAIERQSRGNSINKVTREQGNNLIQSSSYELDLNERGRTHNFSPSEDGAELSRKVLDDAWKNVDAMARQVKGDRTARGRTTGGNALDGSNGILFDDGKLSVINGTAQKLADEYPGIDLQIVCNRAASKVARISNPTRVQVMAAIREYAGYEVLNRQKAATQKATDVGDSDIPAALRQTLKNVAPERREKIIAEFREKRNA